MRLYRIGSALFPVFDGTGAARAGGRWNGPGRPVIYCAHSLACCQLETLVHIGRAAPPTNHLWIEIDVPDGIAATTLTAATLPAGWDDPLRLDVSQAIGDRWLASADTAILRVPSVAAHGDWVVALNPLHPDFASMTASTARPLTWDARLFRA